MSDISGKARSRPVDIAMLVLDELGWPDTESSQEDQINAWHEVRVYIAQLETWCEKRDRYLAELLQKLGLGR